MVHFDAAIEGFTVRILEQLRSPKVTFLNPAPAIGHPPPDRPNDDDYKFVNIAFLDCFDAYPHILYLSNVAT